MKFKSTITTEETYPHSVIMTFACEVKDANDIFKEAHEFEEKIIAGKIVSTTTECEGILQIRWARNEEMHTLENYWELKDLNRGE